MVLGPNQTTIVMSSNQQFLHTPPVIATTSTIRPKKSHVDRSNSPLLGSSTISAHRNSGLPGKGAGGDQSGQGILNAITKGGGSTRPLGVLEEHLIESLKADV